MTKVVYVLHYPLKIRVIYCNCRSNLFWSYTRFCHSCYSFVDCSWKSSVLMISNRIIRLMVVCRVGNCKLPLFFFLSIFFHFADKMCLTLEWTFSLLTDKRLLAIDNSVLWFSTLDTIDITSTYSAILVLFASTYRNRISVGFRMILKVRKKTFESRECPFKWWRKIK